MNNDTYDSMLWKIKSWLLFLVLIVFKYLWFSYSLNKQSNQKIFICYDKWHSISYSIIVNAQDLVWGVPVGE
jgi:hypothetical protein